MANVTVQIRHAVADDEPALIRLFEDLSRFNRSHHPQEDDFEVVLAARRAEARQALASQGPMQAVLVADGPDGIQGYLSVLVFEPPLSSSDGHMRTGLLHELFVTEAARGTGVGRRLLQAGYDWLRASRCTRVRVEAFSWNQRAIRLYEQEGFRPVTLELEKRL